MSMVLLEYQKHLCTAEAATWGCTVFMYLFDVEKYKVFCLMYYILLCIQTLFDFFICLVKAQSTLCYLTFPWDCSVLSDLTGEMESNKSFC